MSPYAIRPSFFVLVTARVLRVPSTVSVYLCIIIVFFFILTVGFSPVVAHKNINYFLNYKGHEFCVLCFLPDARKPSFSLAIPPSLAAFLCPGFFNRILPPPPPSVLSAYKCTNIHVNRVRGSGTRIGVFLKKILY